MAEAAGAPVDAGGTADVVTESAVALSAADGYRLGATLHARSAQASPPTVALITSGYGIPARLYARFARHLAGAGIPTLTFDCRGIGASRPRSLRGFEAVAEDWSELDCAAAIAFLRTRYPQAETVGIAHSYGALLLAGAPNVDAVSRFVFIGAHTGYVGDYLRRYRLPMALVWHRAMPALARLVGYFPGRLLRLGEDLPKGVALQWAARRGPELKPEATPTDVERARAMIARYATRVSGEALVVGFADDAFATAAGTDRFLSLLPGLRPIVRRIAPAEVGMARIGHFGFFRRDAEAALWPIVVAFLRDEPRAPGPRLA